MFRISFVSLFFLLLLHFANAKSVKDSNYTSWVSALSMQGEAAHINATHLPYANPNAKKGGVFKAHAIGGFDSLDLFVLKGNKADSLNLIYDTLMSQSLDEPYAIYPLIADRLSIASDYSGVRFHIDPRARFSNGGKITASDVKFSFDMLIERGDPTQARYYADVAECKVISDSIIEFRFKTTKNKELPFILTQLNIVPRDFYIESSENTYGQKPLRIPLGSGPYRISNFKINSQITYERDKNYWAKDLMVNKGAHNFDKIVIEYYKDENIALQAFLSGEYDYRFEPAAKAWANSYKGAAFSAGRFKMLEFPHGLPSGMQGFYLNTRNAFLADKALREAINQAFDFEWSNKYLFFSQYKRTKSYYENSIYATSGKISESETKILKELGILESNGTISNEFSNELDSRILNEIYTPPITAPLPHSKRENLKYAKKLLESRGFYVKNNQLYNSQHEPLKLSILLNSPLFERIVLPFKKNLAILGIPLQVILIDSTQYENRIKNFDFDIIVGVIPQSLFPGNEQDFFFSSSAASMSGSRNFSGVRLKSVDLLIERLNKTQDLESRVAILRAMDRILLWGFYVVPHFYSPNFRIAVKSDVKIPLDSKGERIFPHFGSPFSAFYFWWRE